MNLLKHLQIKLLCFIVIATAFAACDSDEPNQTPSLSFVESTLPTGDLSVNGGTVLIEIEWSYTRWNVAAAEVVEGAAFITEITPATAGADDRGPGRTKIKITYKANSSAVQNKQTLKLKSLVNENLSHSITLTQPAAAPLEVAIAPTTTFQTVDGFGGANAIFTTTTFLTNSQIKTAFGTDDTDLGLSILRVRISPNQSEWASLVASVKEAEKYNVQILATPWSPPANLKSNSSTIRGELSEANYAAYATYLNDFVQFMAGEGVTIDVVSIQNEPDWPATYESCDWTPTQIYNFIKNNGSAITGAKVMAAESLNFNQNYTNPILNDAAAAANIDVVGGHLYGGGLAPYALAEQKGKPIWMTEYLMNLTPSGSYVAGTWLNATESAKWDETMTMLESVHQAMSYNWNAYIWWYIRRFYSFIGDGEEGTTLGTVMKRGYAFSHFSKFVRPGYVRIDAQASATTGLKMTAYSGDGKIVVVMINPGTSAVSDVSFSVPGTVSSAVAYTTSVSKNRAMTSLTPEGNKVTIDMEARSVTTVIITP